MAREWIFRGRQFDYGWRDRMGAVMVEVYDGYLKTNVMSIERVRRYSCSGINWGSDGAGSKDLAVMLLRTHFQLSGQEQRAAVLADAHHEDFCREIVAKLADVFVLAGCEVEEWYRRRTGKAAQ